jgi:hypothetical protein
MWMNEYEVEEALARFDEEQTPNLYKGAVQLERLVAWVNSNSDGWPYWNPPARAANRLMERLHEADIENRRGREVTDLTDAELKTLLRPVKTFLTKRGEDAEKILNPPPPVYRNPLAEILSAVPDEDERPGVTLTRDQLEAWAGMSLTDEQVAQLDEAIPNSSIPEAIAVIADSIEERS